MNVQPIITSYEISLSNAQKELRTKYLKNELKTAQVASLLLGNTSQTFALDQDDFLAKRSIRDLFKKQSNASMPLFVVLNSGSQDPIADVSSFLKNYLRGLQQTGIGEEPAHTFEVFKNHRRSLVFKKVCDQTNLRDNNDHFLKCIFASDENMNKATRGTCQYYLSVYYKKKIELAISGLAASDQAAKCVKYLGKSYLWLKLAAKSGSIAACMERASLYSNGDASVGIKPSIEKVYKLLAFVIRALPQDDIRFGSVLSLYGEACSLLQTKINQEKTFCAELLNADEKLALPPTVIGK